MTDSQRSKVWSAEEDFLTDFFSLHTLVVPGVKGKHEYDSGVGIWAPEDGVSTIWAMDWDNVMPGFALAREEIRRACRLKFVQANFPQRDIPINREIDVLRGQPHCYGEYFHLKPPAGWRITETNLSLYHQLAHMCIKDHEHGPEFVAAYLKIVGRFLGPLVKKNLRRTMLDRRVKTQVTNDETREKRRQAFVLRRDKKKIVETLTKLHRTADEL